MLADSLREPLGTGLVSDWPPRATNDSIPVGTEHAFSRRYLANSQRKLGLWTEDIEVQHFHKYFSQKNTCPYTSVWLPCDEIASRRRLAADDSPYCGPVRPFSRRCRISWEFLFKVMLAKPLPVLYRLMLRRRTRLIAVDLRPIGNSGRAWLDNSPPTFANRVRLPTRSLQDFRMWELCRTIPLVGGFSRGSPIPALRFIPHLASPASALKISIPLHTGASAVCSLAVALHLAVIGFTKCFLASKSAIGSDAGRTGLLYFDPITKRRKNILEVEPQNGFRKAVSNREWSISPPELHPRALYRYIGDLTQVWAAGRRPQDRCILPRGRLPRSWLGRGKGGVVRITNKGWNRKQTREEVRLVEHKSFKGKRKGGMENNNLPHSVIRGVCVFASPRPDGRGGTTWDILVCPRGLCDLADSRTEKVPAPCEATRQTLELYRNFKIATCVTSIQIQHLYASCCSPFTATSAFSEATSRISLRLLQTKLTDPGELHQRSNVPHSCALSPDSILYKNHRPETWATNAQWLECWPSTNYNRVQSPTRSLQIFASGNRDGRCYLSAGFLGGIPFPRPYITALLHTQLASHSSALKIAFLLLISLKLLSQITAVVARRSGISQLSRIMLETTPLLHGKWRNVRFPGSARNELGRVIFSCAVPFRSKHARSAKVTRADPRKKAMLIRERSAG
ncbi:hypothetical protein PR048_022449 [Dryococelus australis]|uniref:Uncharacterized protein n=1 Tax=Dryococelus australis TaxID=614101 RepID=A0ABQ9H1A2_9NEOP|nr:hypothetical protein PR048_022449 [Dryococelus australis]